MKKIRFPVFDLTIAQTQDGCELKLIIKYDLNAFFYKKDCKNFGNCICFVQKIEFY